MIPFPAVWSHSYFMSCSGGAVICCVVYCLYMSNVILQWWQKIWLKWYSKPGDSQWNHEVGLHALNLIPDIKVQRAIVYSNVLSVSWYNNKCIGFEMVCTRITYWGGEGGKFPDSWQEDQQSEARAKMRHCQKDVKSKSVRFLLKGNWKIWAFWALVIENLDIWWVTFGYLLKHLPKFRAKSS